MIQKDSVDLQAMMQDKSKTVCKRRRLSKRRLSAHNLLVTIGDWEFNIFRMESLAPGRLLFNIGLKMMRDHGLIEAFNLDILKLMRSLSLIEDGYLSENPYHNSIHAADVTQAMNCYLTEHKVAHHVTPLEKMAAIFASLAHDIAHPGVSNSFLINTTNHLASLYNNESVLENHHWRTTCSIFHETGLFEHMDTNTQHTIDRQIKSLILATDITRQKEMISKFKIIKQMENVSFTEENRHTILQIALKCADISNTARAWEVTTRWSSLVCQEFFEQGDNERKLGLAVAALNDRHKNTVANIQIGFIQFVVQPLFREWQTFCPTQQSQAMLEHLDFNLNEWRKVAAEAKERENKQNQIQKDAAKENTCKETSDKMDAIPAKDIPRNAEKTSQLSKDYELALQQATSLFSRRQSLPTLQLTKMYKQSSLRRNSTSLSKKYYQRRNSLPLSQITENVIGPDQCQDSIALRRLSKLSQSDNSMQSVSTNEFQDSVQDEEGDITDNEAFLSVASSYSLAQRRCSAPNFGLTKLMESISENQLSYMLAQSSLTNFTNCARFTSRRHSSPLHSPIPPTHAAQQTVLPLQRAILA